MVDFGNMVQWAFNESKWCGYGMCDLHELRSWAGFAVAIRTDYLNDKLSPRFPKRWNPSLELRARGSGEPAAAPKASFFLITVIFHLSESLAIGLDAYDENSNGHPLAKPRTPRHAPRDGVSEEGQFPPIFSILAQTGTPRAECLNSRHPI